MKLISLISIAVAATIAAGLYSCSNKPPYVELKQAVESIESPGVEGVADLSYDEITNTLKVTYDIPALLLDHVTEAVPGAEAEQAALATVQFLPDGIARKAISAESNVLITYRWNGNSYEQMIEPAQFEELIDAASK